MGDIVDRLLQMHKEEQEIKCPFCGAIQANDDRQYPVTYWGEDGTMVWECDDCNEKFFVEERVERTYTVGKTLSPEGYIIEEEK